MKTKLSLWTIVTCIGLAAIFTSCSEVDINSSPQEEVVFMSGSDANPDKNLARGTYCVYTISVSTPVGGADPDFKPGDKVCYSCPMSGPDPLTICRIDNQFDQEFETDFYENGVKIADVTLTLTGGNGCISCPRGAHNWRLLQAVPAP